MQITQLFFQELIKEGLNPDEVTFDLSDKTAAPKSAIHGESDRGRHSYSIRLATVIRSLGKAWKISGKVKPI